MRIGDQEKAFGVEFFFFLGVINASIVTCSNAKLLRVPFGCCSFSLVF